LGELAELFERILSPPVSVQVGHVILKYAAGVDVDSHRRSIRRQVKQQLFAVTTPNGSSFAAFLPSTCKSHATVHQIARWKAIEEGAIERTEQCSVLLLAAVSLARAVVQA
jgi:hypothetical protein